jgi:DNA-binding GntR family transcriptional regulator
MDSSIPGRLIDLIAAQQLPAGAHLKAQWLADQLQVSRSPVNEALAQLEAKGLVRREPNRGYFLAKVVAHAEPLRRKLGLAAGVDAVSQAYFRIAEDRLRGLLPDEFSVNELKLHYDLTPTQAQAVLTRMNEEGWVQKKPGYGWSFSPMLTTPDSLLQSYRLRLAIEPAALLEPGYKLDAAVLARCRAAEEHLLQGGIATDTADQLHDRGVRFHESLVEASGNPFFIDTVRRVNRVRRLLSYRSMQDRKRYKQHCEQHLALLDLLTQGRNEQASAFMREHLQSTLNNLTKIRKLLK